MKDLKQTTVIGLGLLGGSISLAVLRSFTRVKVIGYTHRPSTRTKARGLAVATEIVDCLKSSVSEADLVILATPIVTFEKIFSEIADALPNGCIVTDVGSTKVLPHRWAAKKLPKSVHYVGSHPIAGSEQRGIEFARDDLFDGAMCILTTTKKTNRQAVQTLKKFWSKLGCSVKSMTPAEHDRIFANVSHLPHITAAALINANNNEELKFAGKGFIDTSRIASGPVNIWADVLLTNANNTTKGIDKIIAELVKLKKAIKKENKREIEKLLEKARTKRAALIKYKIKKKEIIS
ncbi:MAG: prephenate dehydrogenase/arogenate dehydrogenase family protein [Planctomycetes bacterium]|nr:prephenate dehydrogenase/arogenate dehydrogenase family protein [Planctomycetota bacterium]MCH8120549.1 prephenate dehydrogenase/arogenate dehydrogenase family protein [Planctomycetota bacterium]